MDSVYSNFEAIEGNTEGSSTLTFKFKSRRVHIMNDSSTTDLKFRFSTAYNWATLKPQESVLIDIWSKELLLSATNVEYRVWTYG